MDIAKIKACKDKRMNVKHFLKDKENCWITSMAVTHDGRIMMVDFYNKKIKVFGSKTESQMRNSTFMPASGEVRDVSIINETEAVVTMGCEQKLDILSLADETPSVKETVQLKFDAMCVAVCQGAFVVTCPNTSPPSVKKIDRSGKVMWTSVDDRISDPWNICSSSDGVKVYLTGRESHSIIMLSSDTGKVERTRKVSGKHPRGLCSDRKGNIYVCYQNSIGVLTGDLSEENVLLSEKDGIDGLPEAIAYDANHDRLFISYSPLEKNCNSVDSIQLT